MKEIIFKGKDIEEAMKKASDELGITTDNIEFEIVTLGNKGLFGIIGRKNAELRVFIGGKGRTSRDKKRERPERNKPKAEARQKNEPSRKREPKPKKEAISVKPDREARPKKDTRQKAKKDTRPRAPRQEPAGAPVEDIVRSPEDVKKIEEFVLQIISRLDENVQVSSFLKKNKIVITVDSHTSGKIIGKGGHIINSCEYLTTKYAHKVFGQKTRVTLHILGGRKPSP